MPTYLKLNTGRVTGEELHVSAGASVAAFEVLPDLGDELGNAIVTIRNASGTPITSIVFKGIPPGGALADAVDISPTGVAGTTDGTLAAGAKGTFKFPLSSYRSVAVLVAPTALAIGISGKGEPASASGGGGGSADSTAALQTDLNNRVGALSSPAATDDTGTWSLSSLIKRALQNWTTLQAKIPALASSGSIPVSASNINTKFREAFESYTPGVKWGQVMGSGDLIFVDGNAAAASYLVISKDPLTAGTETTVETIQTFGMPFEASIGLSMSQRTAGQELAVEFVDTLTPLADVPDLEISSITQTTTTLTIDTVLDHGLSVGKSIGVRGCSNPIANYPSLVVASCPSPRQITCTAGPGGNIPSQTITNPAGVKGWIYFRERLGRAQNGVSQIFENVTATNSSAYLRSEAGDALPSGTIAGNHALTVGSTASVQLVNSPFQYAFSPTTEFRWSVQADRVQLADVGVDQVAQALSRTLRTQVIPGSEHPYKLRFRFVNNKALTVPNAQILSATKTGTTTATIVTATAHGLALGDPVVIYGIRAQGATEFPNLLVATAVASVVDATTFTIVQGTAGTITSYGGFVARVNGGNLGSALGYSAVVAQAAVLTTLTSGVRQLVLTGNTNWASLSIGDHVNLVGVRNATDGATVGVDGVWKVANVATTALTLVPGPGNSPPADFGSVNCGGGVIKRTEARISFVRVFDYERERVEIMPRPAGDIAGAAPVAVQNVPAVTLSSGTVTTVTTVTALAGGQAAHDAVIAGAPLRTGGRAVTANYAAVASGDVADHITTLVGAQVTKPYAIPEAEWSFTGALTTTSDVVVQAAAGAGLKRHATWVQATNTGGAAVDVLLRDGTNTRLQITVPAGQSVDFALPTGIPTTANTALNVQLSAVGTVRFNALGYTAP